MRPSRAVVKEHVLASPEVEHLPKTEEEIGHDEDIRDLAGVVTEDEASHWRDNGQGSGHVANG